MNAVKGPVPYMLAHGSCPLETENGLRFHTAGCASGFWWALMVARRRVRQVGDARGQCCPEITKHTNALKATHEGCRVS